MKLTKVQKVAAKAALVGAGDRIATNRAGTNYVCNWLDNESSSKVAKKFFLQIYGDNSKVFCYFGMICRTFNRASNFDNSAADEHRLTAISLAITLLQDKDFDLTN